MRYLYSALFYLLLPLILLRMLWRSRRAPAYRQRLVERFGLFPAPATLACSSIFWPLRLVRHRCKAKRGQCRKAGR